MALIEDVDITNPETFPDRNFGIRNLSKALLSPNVVRIELLSGNKVLRYLGELERMGYANVRTPLMAKAGKNFDDNVFYGILKGGVDHTWESGADWSAPSAGGGLLGMMRTMAGKIPVVGPSLKIAETAVKIGERVTGTNTSATGSSTMKQYNGAKLKSPTITVSWYLPEQYGMCIRGLQTLSRMAYARPIDEEAFINTLTNQVGELVTGAITKLTNSVTGVPPSVSGKDDEAGVVAKLSGDVLGGGIGLAATGAFAVNSFFGKNLTFDPTPVRLCVGQFMDVEPLVITNLKITFSKEQFVSNAKINAIPLHLPIFCTAEIAFDYWLNPSPSLQFMNFLGVEMFGNQLSPNTVADLAAEEIRSKSREFN